MVENTSIPIYPAVCLLINNRFKLKIRGKNRNIGKTFFGQLKYLLTSRYKKIKIGRTFFG